MINAAWEHLQRKGAISNTELLASNGLNVKRSSFVCALLSRLPNVEVDGLRPIRLRLIR